MHSIAELEFHYGLSDEYRFVIHLAQDTTLTLFMDGSSILDGPGTMIITECCWADEVCAPTFIDLYHQTSTLMKPSNDCIELIKSFEGLRLKAYKDSAGVMTIGYGITRMNGHSVFPKTTITLEQAESLLLREVENTAQSVMKHVQVPITQSMFDALVSLAYNIGIYAFADSTLLRVLNERKWAEAADEFLRWDKCTPRRNQKRSLPGLTRRRKAERELFLRDGM